jgi:ABC-2 type transport system ATP-binding protein
MDEADRCDELLLMFHGKVLARGSGVQIRQQAGVENMEDAFLKLGGGESEDTVAAGAGAAK